MTKRTIEEGLREMEAILKRAEVGRIALSDDSKPYIIPINFYYQEGQIAFHCAWKGKKLDIIKKNPHCCFEVDEFNGEVTYHYDAPCHLEQDSVLAFGTASIEDKEDIKLQFFQHLHAKYKELYRTPIAEGGVRFNKARLHEACCVIININELTGRRERNRKQTTWRFKFS